MSSGAQVELGNNGENEDAVHTDRYIFGMIGALIEGRNFLPLIVLGCFGVPKRCQIKGRKFLPLNSLVCRFA